MKSTLKKGLFTGFGLALIAKDKLQDIAQEISKEAKLTQEEGEKLYNNLIEKSDKYKSQVEQDIGNIVNKTIKKLNLPDSKEVKALKDEINKLKEEIHNLKSSQNKEIID